MCLALPTIGWGYSMPKIERLKIPGVKAYLSKGKSYAYHRKTGHRFKSLYGTAAFFEELRWVEASVMAQVPRPKQEQPGTWGAVVALYRKDFLPTKAPRTQRDYQKILDWMKPLDGMDVALMNRAFVMRLRDKAFKQHKRRFANYIVAVIQSVLTWGVDREYVANHDVRNIKPIKRPKDMPRANRPWTRQEWQTVIAAAPKHLLAPILLCGVLGWREGEAITRPRSDYDPKTKRIKRISLKSGKQVRTPVPRLVSDALDSLLPHGATTLIVNSKGSPWTPGGFRASVFTFLGKLCEAGRIGDDLTVHGLRHTVGTIMREVGFDKDTIADMLGQETAGMAEWYARDAVLDRKLAGVVQAIDEHLTGTKLSNSAD
jgi:integrase